MYFSPEALSAIIGIQTTIENIQRRLPIEARLGLPNPEAKRVLSLIHVKSSYVNSVL
jgi:hypothetical protein